VVRGLAFACADWILQPKKGRSNFAGAKMGHKVLPVYGLWVNWPAIQCL